MTAYCSLLLYNKYGPAHPGRQDVPLKVLKKFLNTMYAHQENMLKNFYTSHIHFKGHLEILKSI